MASKDVVIKHMNANHPESLELFLQAYCAISAREAQTAQLEDISNTHLVIRAHGTRYSVPIDPPLKNISDARGRLVAMHNDSLQRLGRSDVTLTEYRGPRGVVQTVVFALCVFTYISCFQRSNLLPGASVYEYLGYKYVPDFAHFVYTIQPYLFPGVLVIHLLEASFLAVKRLKPLGVPLMSGLWWMWVSSCFIEGFGVWQRIAQIVKEERAKKGKQQ
ncbi:hypothetical protein NUU61_009286 [Penicillium alfredii]|uniref:DUF2470 domain-containing protein n=1 Tax=Penicillium alfredii TaxID=1506179 RepID=A0A9W9JXJ5_9EURO|nr:uncharacterized protein NUU61_009286 [Penicillium alfredii]KAJ5084707.1 hypothetical protein NUU61_009286 [Penicillium alfredii]